MKPFVEKLTLEENTSFLARTYRTPKFEVHWHQHIEYEMILFLEGEGLAYIGNYVGEFKTGDVFFLGSNLPHTFQKAQPGMTVSAVVIQFRKDCWGPGLLQLPESREINSLLDKAILGFKIEGQTRSRLQHMIPAIEKSHGFARIVGLLQCLLLLGTEQEFQTVSTQEALAPNEKQKKRIDRIFQYTIDHFQDPVSLPEVAADAGMSVPAFCNYFKKTTKKTYVDFLNEVRIGNACQLLIDTQKNIEAICYESGFNTLANFNKQFLKIKSLTPSRYRKIFLTRDSAQ